MSKSNPAWQFVPGELVETRLIVAQLRPGSYPALNVYLIEYPCHPGMEYEMQEQSLRKALKENSPALCPSCRRAGKGIGSKKKRPAVLTTSYPSWPAPPSILTEKRY